MQIELPTNVVAAFGQTPDTIGACLWLISVEGEVWERYGCHPVDLTVPQLREIFGVVVH